MNRFWVMGDVHGERAKLVALLREAGLLDRREAWTGGDATLVCVGDYVDRGPDGVGVITLLRELELLAPAAGGQVITLLGNHEVLLLAAQRFGTSYRDAQGRSFHTRWQDNGGRKTDLAALTPELTDWLIRRPALARLGSFLLAHADAPFYLRYGRHLDLVNDALTRQLISNDPGAWDRLIVQFSAHSRFDGPEGPAQARLMLQTYGGMRLIHGHTPIAYMLGSDPAEMRSPLLYAEGLCLNVDGGLAYHPQAGFLIRIGEGGLERTVSFSQTQTQQPGQPAGRP